VGVYRSKEAWAAGGTYRETWDYPASAAGTATHTVGPRILDIMRGGGGRCATLASD
jgi:hypothetical protein